MNFTLTDEQTQKLVEWMNQLPPSKYEGAIGGRFTYSFTPTSLGDVMIVTDTVNNLSIDLSEYDLW